MRILSLFCGCGGLDMGFVQSGFDIVWANDFDKYAVQTYKANFDHRVVEADINKVDLDALPDFDVLIGGFPCQPFSMMGEERGFEDARGTLFFRIAEIIKDRIQKGKKPAAIILENVRSLRTHDGGRTFKTIKNILENELKYKFFSDILNTADYGIPQTRNKQGRYYIPKSVAEAYPNPHRDENGKIIIENSTLYHDDVNNHGAYNAQQWVKQGKYNLTSEEMKVEHAKIQLDILKLYSIRPGLRPEEEKSKVEYERIISEANIDWTQTEAAKVWSRAHSVDMSYRQR